MKKHKAVSVYLEKGKTNVKEAMDRTGVYMIFKDGKLRYIGHSVSNLYKTLLRHFQSWKDKTQVRVTYPQDPSYTVRIVYCSARQAPALEAALIKKYKPVDNPNKYEQLKLDTYAEKTLENYQWTPYSGENPF